jgi:hypothetical protein
MDTAGDRGRRPHGLSLGSGDLVPPNPLNAGRATPVVRQWTRRRRLARLASTVLAEERAPLGSVRSPVSTRLAADVVPASPAQPAPGELLAGVDAGLIPADASAVVNPQPKILFYKPGVKSDVRGTVTTTGAPLPSGTIVRSRIVESYQFVTTGEIHPDPIEQDLVLYQIPGGPLPVMAAGFPSRPGSRRGAVARQGSHHRRAPRAGRSRARDRPGGADGGSIAAAVSG